MARKHRHSNHHSALPITLPCGCAVYPGERGASFPCRRAAQLISAAEFAEMLAAGIPNDPLFQRLVDGANAAFDQHFGVR
jgi:hypothetical protein